MSLALFGAREVKRAQPRVLPTSGQNLNLFWLKLIFPPLICVPGKIKGDVNKHLSALRTKHLFQLRWPDRKK